MDAGAPPVGAPAGAAPCVGAALLGKRVRLHSLNSIVFNDMAAAVIGWDHASGRWMVRLEGSGKELKVKPANVAFEDPADEPLAAMAGAMDMTYTKHPTTDAVMDLEKKVDSM